MPPALVAVAIGIFLLTLLVDTRFRSDAQRMPTTRRRASPASPGDDGEDP